ncbi:MAG: SUMF1/EgtB/PvdO family nonheme iron enzyme [Minisyncoccia bacterium]
MKWGRVILIIFGALLVTALGIDASDTINGSKSTLLSQVISRNEGKCPSGMSPVENIPSVTCVDTYESSTNAQCPVANPEQMLGTIKNYETTSCAPESKQNASPWRFVTRDQSVQLCARAGKRLPTSEEWYALSSGMAAVEANCNVSTKNMTLTGAQSLCVSPHGAYDLVGNVWEWVSDDVIDGMYKSNKLPESGYVAQIDSTGMATVGSTEPQELFGKDYFWSRASGAYGIIRGGYYDSGTDAGVYTVHADTLPTSASAGVGFRCLK